MLSVVGTRVPGVEIRWRATGNERSTPRSLLVHKRVVKKGETEDGGGWLSTIAVIFSLERKERQ